MHEEIIQQVEEWIKSVPDIRERIKFIDLQLSNGIENIEYKENLKYEKIILHLKLSDIIRTIGILSLEEQKIICYRYFEKLKYSEIARKTGVPSGSIKGKIKKALLKIYMVRFEYKTEFYSLY